MNGAMTKCHFTWNTCEKSLYKYDTIFYAIRLIFVIFTETFCIFSVYFQMNDICHLWKTIQIWFVEGREHKHVSQVYGRKFLQNVLKERFECKKCDHQFRHRDHYLAIILSELGRDFIFPFSYKYLWWCVHVFTTYFITVFAINILISF